MVMGFSSKGLYSPFLKGHKVLLKPESFSKGLFTILFFVLIHIFSKGLVDKPPWISLYLRYNIPHLASRQTRKLKRALLHFLCRIDPFKCELKI